MSAAEPPPQPALPCRHREEGLEAGGSWLCFLREIKHRVYVPTRRGMGELPSLKSKVDGGDVEKGCSSSRHRPRSPRFLPLCHRLGQESF